MERALNYDLMVLYHNAFLKHDQDKGLVCIKFLDMLLHYSLSVSADAQIMWMN